MKKSSIKAGLFGFLSILLVFAMAGFANADIFINEFLVETDPSTGEWIELFNNGSSSVNLANWNITDASNNNLTLDITIATNGYIILSRNFAVLNVTYPGINNTGKVVGHNKFELNDGGDILFLYNSSSDLVDTIAFAGPGDNITVGRHPDGSSKIINLSVRTPGAKNDNASPVLNKWVNPSKNNSFIKGLANITVNITDAAHNVNVSLIDFNNSNFSMSNYNDLWYFVWNTSQNAEKLYNITISFNDSVGLSSRDALFNVTIDNTVPKIDGPNTTANSRNFVNPGFLFNASVNATDTNMFNVTCALSSSIVGNFTSSGKTHTCNLTAPSSEGDFDIIFTAIDRAGSKNTTNISFTTKYTTSTKLVIRDITVSDLNQSSKIIEVNATLNNTGNNPIYDAGIILDSFSSTLLSATTVSHQSCSENINSSQSCNVTFNVTVSGGATGTHNIFWNANWTDNNFTKRQFDSVKISSATISNNPQATAADNVSASIPHGTNATVRVHINSTGNFKLENVNVKFVEGALKSPFLNATSTAFSSIDAGANESVDINVAMPKYINPDNYTGLLNITATGISPRIVKLIVEVPLDNSWTSLPNSTVTYAKSSTAGLAGSFKINNTGNIGQNYSLAKAGNFVTYNLWDSTNPDSIYVEAGEAKAVAIYHLAMEGSTPIAVGSFNLTITMQSQNTSQTNKTLISLVRDDNAPNVNATSPSNNSFVKGDVIFMVNASDLNLSRIEFYINNSIILKDTNFTKKFNWTSANGSYADDIYELKAIAFDSAGNSNVSAVNVTLNNSDSNPVLLGNIPTISVIEDNDSTILNLSLFFKTIDGDALKYNFTKPNNVTVHVNNGTQTANFTPAANFSGINFIIFTAIDTSNQTTSSNNVTLNVVNVNDEPTIPLLLSPKNNSNISSATGRALLAWNASKDADSDTLTYYIFLSNDSNDIRLNSTTIATTLELTGIDSNKKYFWNVLASDDKANSSKSKTFEFVLTGDSKPVINSWKWNNTINDSSTNTSPAVAENKTLSFKIDASDPDKDAINFTWFRDNAEINTTQNFTFNLVNNFSAAGAYALKLVVTDNNSNSVSQEWQVSVTNTNREPVLDAIANREAVEDSVLTFNITALDPDNDTLTFTSNISSVSFAKNANNSLATVSWTPTNDNVGNNTIQFTLKDGSKNDSKIIVITVNNTNDAPVITSSLPKEDKTIAENAGRQEFNFTVVDVDVGDTVNVKWYRNGTLIRELYNAQKIPPGSVLLSDSIIESGLAKGIYNITIIANDTSSSIARHEWKLIVTTDIISENLTSPVLSLNETQRQNVTNVTINQSAFGGIDFGNNSLNFSGIVKLEDAFNVSRGFVSIDTDTYPALKSKPASLVMKGLNFTKAPLIYKAEGFETTSGAILCPADVCTSITYDKTNGALRFRAANFSTYFAQANTTNGAPVITSTAITTATERATYKYDVDATDPDGDTLVFSLSTAPTGMSISSSTGLITWAPSSSQIGSNNVVVNVSDGNLSAGQSFVIKVDKGPRLAISDLDIAVDGKTDKNVNNNSKITEEAKPGSKVEFKIEFENLFSDEEDLEIEDIDAEITIEDIDDGDDLEENADGIDIKQGKDDTVNVEFEIPLEVEEGEYDVVINADGEDENNTRHEALFIVKLEVDKEQHEIRITNAQISPLTVQCQRQISINAEIMNTGAKDEDEVSLEISNSQLGISSLTEGIELDEGTDDNVYSKLLNYKIGESVSAGVYPITIKTKYGGKESDTETLNLEVKDCEKFKDIKKEVKEERPKVQTTKPVSKMQPKASSTAGITQKSPADAKNGRFLLVSILAIVFVGTLIFVVGGAFIVLRK